MNTQWKLNRILNRIDAFYLTNLMLKAYIMFCLCMLISGNHNIEKRIEKLESSISVMSEGAYKTKAQLYLEKFGDHEFPPACDPPED